MKKILIISIFSILFLICTTPAFADVIEPGEKNIPLYYKISNINDYPEYVLFAHGDPSPPIEALNSSEFSFYKLSTVSIYAIKKSDYKHDILKNMDDTQIRNFINNSKIIKSDLSLDGNYGTVGIDSSLDKALVELQITSINDSNMNIKKAKVIYTYSDGSTQEKSITNQEVLPQPSKKSYFWYFLIPLLAIIVIGAILIKRR